MPSRRAVPAGKIVHAIIDNYAAHKHPKVRAWLDRHPRWTFHFTPTSCSWLNAVEGFFAKLSRRRLKRGVFRSVADLQAAINRFIDETNDNPKPFVWTADPNRIIAAVKRGHQALELDPLAQHVACLPAPSSDPGRRPLTDGVAFAFAGLIMLGWAVRAGNSPMNLKPVGDVA